MKDDDFSKIEAHASHYSEEGFWDKLGKHAKAVGIGGIRYALRLWYALDNPELPTKVRAVIYGALGYFILPIDLIPDFMPGVGFSDDIAVLGAAVAIASMYINQDVKDKAEQKLRDWFGDTI